jgi:hypothetical protein
MHLATEYTLACDCDRHVHFSERLYIRRLLIKKMSFKDFVDNIRTPVGITPPENMRVNNLISFVEIERTTVVDDVCVVKDAIYKNIPI